MEKRKKNIDENDDDIERFRRHFGWILDPGDVGNFLGGKRRRGEGGVHAVLISSRIGICFKQATAQVFFFWVLLC